MNVLIALLGLATSVLSADETVETNGMPPFVFLSPPHFRVGHTVSALIVNSLLHELCIRGQT